MMSSNAHSTQRFLPVPSCLSLSLSSLSSPSILLVLPPTPHFRFSGRWTQSCFHCWSCKGSLTARGEYGEAIPPSCMPLRSHCQNNQKNRLYDVCLSAYLFVCVCVCVCVCMCERERETEGESVIKLYGYGVYLCDCSYCATKCSSERPKYSFR